MSDFFWTENLSIDHEKIDVQHKELIRLIVHIEDNISNKILMLNCMNFLSF